MQNSNREINECTSRGVCTVSPTIAAMHEIILLFLGQISYYILKLEKLGGNNKKILISIINDIAGLNYVNVVKEKAFYEVLIRNYLILKNVEKIYTDYCKQNGINYRTLSLPETFDENMPFPKVISYGEKLILNNYKNLSGYQKSLSDILFVVIKSVCRNLSNLYDFGVFYTEGYQSVLEGLNILNRSKCTQKQLQSGIEHLAKLDTVITKELGKNLFDKFGKISKVEVSRSTRKGKAILVSGCNYFDLYNILEETKDKDIDVYTHANLLIAHCLEKFHKYSHLAGHYGNNTESCIVDYGTFPGAILLTKGERSCNEYLYRARLFSKDYFTSTGVIKIEDNNYSPVIEAAKLSKGFSKGKIKEPVVVGFDEEEIIKEFDKINTRLKNEEITHVYIIGLNPHSEKQKEYFTEFFAHMKNSEFAISFSYESKRENVYSINIGNYAPLALHLLAKFLDGNNLSDKITFIYTSCDAMTISGIIMLKSKGAKSVYMADCPPNLLNPAVFATFLDEYNIKINSDAVQDLHDIRNAK